MDKTKLWYISANKIFSGLPGKDQREIASRLTEMHVKRKKISITQGIRQIRSI